MADRLSVAHIYPAPLVTAISPQGPLRREQDILAVERRYWDLDREGGCCSLAKLQCGTLCCESQRVYIFAQAAPRILERQMQQATLRFTAFPIEKT
jgi:hypothetical protein